MARALAPDGYYPNTRRPPPGGNPNARAQAMAGRQSRLNQFGTANPYANSTNQNPYAAVAWLGSGFPHPLPTVPADVPIPDDMKPLQYGASRPSYDLAGIAALLGPAYHIPLRADYGVLMKIREAIPMISAAILRMKELVGTPSVQARPDLKRKIDLFLAQVPANRMQTGFHNWCQTHYDNMYTFGRAHCEVLLNDARTDVFGLVEVHPTTTGIRPTFGGYAVNVVQYQYGGGVPVTLLPELLLSSVNDIRGDDPNGTSLIAELPFVAQILNSMLRGIGNTWDRFGSPTFWLNWEPPDNWDDPSGTQAGAILGTFQNRLQSALAARTEGKANDFMTSGKVTVEILGAQGDTLEFEASGRAIMEQICARFGLPPFMYGFSWASTERMSTAQSKILSEIIESSRAVVSPQILKLINLWQLVTGNRGPVSLEWPRTSLQDLIDVARARAMDAQAATAELSNFSILVSAGINSMEEMAQHFRDDLDGLSPEDVRKRLPKLAAVPPVVGVAPPGAGGGDIGAGAGGNAPADEATRMLVGNGNGRH
jgi:hypothetical protein